MTDAEASPALAKLRDGRPAPLKEPIVDQMTSPVAEQGSKFSIFRFADAQSPTETGLMTYADEPGVDKHQSDIDAGGLRDGTELRVLYKQPDASPVNLVHAWFKPHFLLPRHTHNGDCLYYIILGSLQMGSRTLTSGDGFFVPADTRYGYQAGPDGVEVLEIRIAPEFDLRFTETEGRWHEIVKVAHENHTLWKGMVTPPSRQKAPDGDASLSGSP